MILFSNDFEGKKQKAKHKMNSAQSNFDLAQCKIERQGIPNKPSVLNHNNVIKGTDTWTCLDKNIV